MPFRPNPKVLNSRIRQPRGMNTGATTNLSDDMARREGLFTFDSAPVNNPGYLGDEKTASIRGQEQYEKTRRTPFVESNEAKRLYRQSASNDPNAQLGENGRFPDTQTWPDPSQLNSRYKPEQTMGNGYRDLPKLDLEW